MINDKSIPSLDFENIDKSNETKNILNNKVKDIVNFSKDFTLDILKNKVNLNKLAKVFI